MPICAANARIAVGESKGWLKPMLTTLNCWRRTPGPTARTATRQRLRRGGADLEAAGVDEAHQQRLAAIVGQPHRPLLAVEQRCSPTARPIAASLARSAVTGSSADAVDRFILCSRGRRREHGVQQRHQTPKAHRNKPSIVAAASTRLSCTSDAKNDRHRRLAARRTRQPPGLVKEVRATQRCPDQVDRPGAEEHRQQRRSDQRHRAAEDDMRRALRADHHRQHRHAGGRVVGAGWRSPGSRNAAASTGTAPAPAAAAARPICGSTAAAPASTAKLPARPPTTMLSQVRRFSHTV